MKIPLNFKFLMMGGFLFFHSSLVAKDYYVHPKHGSDLNNGLTKEFPLKSLVSISKISLQPGDRILLASNELYQNGISLINQNGAKDNPIIITTINWNPLDSMKPAIINFKGSSIGVLLQDCSFIEVSDLILTANGYVINDENQKMRCGILITNIQTKLTHNIKINNVKINKVYFENFGFERGVEEVKTANGTQKYGWGIRVLNNSKGLIKDIQIKNCSIKNVSHTGIKLTGAFKNISNISISGNYLEKTGGPGIQMSGVKNVHVSNNVVTHSGSKDDSRKWGRGSGLWTWGSSHVLIEHNKFLYANGPGDSAGAHIDFNCDNVVLQYNISAYNAGGFCEILGNNYNCAYRYNISINDGHRVKGLDGAFQEGKILWLSGYQGEKKPRKGPVNSYFYNNTIYSDSTIVSKIAIDNTSKGILIANNIFYLKGGAKAVLGDQYKPDEKSNKIAENVYFKNNLFLKKDSWPEDVGIKDIAPVIGNPQFSNEGGINANDYIPENIELVNKKGIEINLLPNDTAGLMQSLKLEKDILGNDVNEIPSLGAIEPIKSNLIKNQ